MSLRQERIKQICSNRSISFATLCGVQKRSGEKKETQSAQDLWIVSVIRRLIRVVTAIPVEPRDTSWIRMRGSQFHFSFSLPSLRGAESGFIPAIHFAFIYARIFNENKWLSSTYTCILFLELLQGGSNKFWNNTMRCVLIHSCISFYGTVPCI